jgi:hypothetical protein
MTALASQSQSAACAWKGRAPASSLGCVRGCPCRLLLFLLRSVDEDSRDTRYKRNDLSDSETNSSAVAAVKPPRMSHSRILCSKIVTAHLRT